MAHEVETPRERSWRDVRQAVNPRAMTPQGRRRLGWSVVRTTCSVLVLGGVVAGGAWWYAGGGLGAPSGRLSPVVKAEPLRDFIVLTDGVLNEAWVIERLALPEGIALMAIDLDAVKNTLEADGQVRRAVVAREYPGTLVMTLEERVPVVRVMVPLEPGRPEPLLVARDGEVFRGFNYDPQMIARLPWLDGVRLARRTNGSIVPIEGLDRVSELLHAGKHDAPQLARDWEVVSLAEQPRLVVRTPMVREIVFEAGNYRRQLARLDYILDLYRGPDAARGAITRIDLSIAAQVAVEFAHGGARRPPAREVVSTSALNP